MTLFLVLLATTMLLEAPFYLRGLKDHPLKTRVAFWIGANLLSYPAVFFLFPCLDLPAWTREAGAEIWAPASEILIGWYVVPRFSRRDAAVVIFANLFSWLSGRLLLTIPWVKAWLYALV